MSKEKYNELLKVVKQVVNAWDPIGVLPDAPDDEYEFEIGKIVALLNKVGTVDALSDGIGMIFTKALDRNFSKKDCLPIAKEIWREF